MASEEVEEGDPGGPRQVGTAGELGQSASLGSAYEVHGMYGAAAPSMSNSVDMDSAAVLVVGSRSPSTADKVEEVSSA